MKYSIGRLECAILQNKSGTSLAQGDVCIIDTSNIKAITTTTTNGYSSGRVGVVVETSGIAVDGWGLVAFSGVAPKVNLASSASIGDMIKTHTVAKQATPHASPFLVGDFAQVLETGTSPSCILFGSVVDVTGSGTYLTPSGLTGATQTSRWVGSTTAGAPVTGTFQVGDWVIDQTGVLWVCTVAGSPGTWVSPPPTVSGYLPKVFPQNYVSTSAFTTALSLPANGGTIAVPMVVTAPMLLQSISVRNTDTTTARTWGWDLYVQQGLTNVLTRVAACSANETYTPTAASTRTVDVGSAPVSLSVGNYWLAIQNRHATSTFGIGTTAISTAFVPNLQQTKTTTNPNGSTLDFTAATWTKTSAIVAVSLNGRVFGESTAF